MTKWLPTNKWLVAQGVLLTAISNGAFDDGWNDDDWKLAVAWGIQAVVTYFVSNKRLPDEGS